MFKKILGLLLCAVLAQPAAIFSSDSESSDCLGQLTRSRFPLQTWQCELMQRADISRPESSFQKLKKSLQKENASLRQGTSISQEIMALLLDAINSSDYTAVKGSIKVHVNYWKIDLKVIFPQYELCASFPFSDRQHKFKGLPPLIADIVEFMKKHNLLKS